MARSGRLALAAAAALLLLGSLSPVLAVVFVSVRDAPPGQPGQFVLDNWIRLLAEPEHIQATIGLAAASAIVTLPVGIAIAWLLTRTNVPLRGLLAALMPLPLLVSTLLTVIAYITLLAPRSGLLNALLDAAFGVRLDIFSAEGIVFLMSIHFVPFVYFLTTAALDAIDVRYEEALCSAGGGLLATLRFVSLPLIRPALLSAALLIFVFGAETFTVPTLLGPTARIYTLQSDIFRAMSGFPSSPGFAAAAGTTLMLLAGVGLWLRGRVAGDPRRYVSLSGRAASRRLIDLGRARWPAFALVATYLTLAVALPYLALVLGSLMRFVTPNLSLSLLTLQNFQDLLAGSLAQSLANSLLTGLVSATVSVSVAIVLAHVVARQKSRLAAVLQLVATLPLSIPSLSLGLGILWVYVLLPLPLYGTIWILVIAYCTRYIGSALVITSARLTQIDPELHEAIRISGATERQAFTLVTVPLADAALRSAWALLFVQAIMEISMTIMLYSSASATASVQVWLQESMSRQSQAHALAVILATVGFAVLALQRRLSRAGQFLPESAPG